MKDDDDEEEEEGCCLHADPSGQDGVGCSKSERNKQRIPRPHGLFAHALHYQARLNKI